MKNISLNLAFWSATATLIAGAIQGCGSLGNVASTVPMTSPVVTLYFDGVADTFTLADFAIALALVTNNEASVQEIKDIAQDIFGLALTDEQILRAGEITGQQPAPLALFDLDGNGIPGELADFAVAVAVLLGSTDISTVEATAASLFGLTLTLDANLPLPVIGATPFPSSSPTLPPAGSLVTTLIDENGENSAACSLREAIIANNKGESFGGCEDPKGVIGFASTLRGGTIRLTAEPAVITADVQIQGLGSDKLTISGDNQFRVFAIAGTQTPLTVGISELTIANGSTEAGAGILDTGSGAGIRATNTILTVTNSAINTNKAHGNGGGIALITSYLSDAPSRLTIQGSSFQGNEATFSGGAIHEIGLSGNVSSLRATISVSDSSFSSNQAELDGGAITIIDALSTTMRKSEFSANSAGRDGGAVIYVSRGSDPDITTFPTFEVVETTFASNVATVRGGGLALAGNGAQIVVAQSVFTDNRADSSGGGIDATIGGSDALSNQISVTIRETELTGNTAELNGGGLYLRVPFGEAWVDQSTIVNNVSTAGGGLRGEAKILKISTSTVMGNHAERGGGIAVDSATINSSTIANNTAGAEGGIKAINLLITNSTIINNLATGAPNSFAGGIGSYTLTMNNSTVSGNQATTGAGGGITTLLGSITDSLITNNSSALGGGGISALRDLTVANSIVSSNMASRRGGGIEVQTGTTTIIGSTIANNQVAIGGPGINEAKGGGIAAEIINITNSTLSGNRSIEDGGGVYAPFITVNNSTIVFNTAATGGGLLQRPSGISTQVLVNNSIVSGNAAPPPGIPDVNNFLGSNNLVGQDIATILDPILKNNGGFTPGAPGSTAGIPTHALIPGSPAINGGDNSLVPTDITTDQRGEGFPRIVSGTLDIGAVESDL